MKNIKMLITLVTFACISLGTSEKPGKIYISNDRGVSWQVSDSGFPDDGVTAWVLSNNIIFAGTDSHGVMISEDHAKTWYSSANGLPAGVRITALIATNNAVYAGTSGNGVYYSGDNGAHWHPSSTGINNSSIRAFVMYGGSLLAGTNDGLYKSVDDGNFWTRVDIKPATSYDASIDKSGSRPSDKAIRGPIQVNSFAQNGSTIYVATNLGVFRSNNRAITWDHIFKQGAIASVATLKTEICLLDYSSIVYRSYTNKIIWLRDDLFIPPKSSFQLTPASPKMLNFQWGNSIDCKSISPNSGLPQDVPFTQMIDTPFGLLISPGGGC